MAKKSTAQPLQVHENQEGKYQAIEAARLQLEKQFGKGAIMKLGEESAHVQVETISTGSIGLDMALGVGGVPRGRIVEIPVEPNELVEEGATLFRVDDAPYRDKVEALGRGGADTRVTLLSFGFKYGIPLDADLVLDMRFLPNPHYVESLQPHSGMEPAVAEYVFKWPVAAQFLEKLLDFLFTGIG